MASSQEPETIIGPRSGRRTPAPAEANQHPVEAV